MATIDHSHRTRQMVNSGHDGDGTTPYAGQAGPTGNATEGKT